MRKAEIIEAINDGVARFYKIPARYLQSRVWIVGVGHAGCLYDASIVFATKKDAMTYAKSIIEDYCAPKGAKTDVEKHGIAVLNESGTRFVEVSRVKIANVI